MGKVDGLSRRPDWQKGVEKDNKDQTLIKPKWIRGMETLMQEEDLKERIRKAQKGNKKIVKAVEELKKAGIKTLRDKEWKVENRIVMKEGRIYVPEGDLRREIIQLYHDTPVGGHGGRWKMTEFVYNNKVHTATKTSLFKANYGQDPKMGLEERRKGKYEAVEKSRRKQKQHWGKYRRK